MLQSGLPASTASSVMGMVGSLAFMLNSMNWTMMSAWRAWSITYDWQEQHQLTADAEPMTLSTT